MAGLSRAELRQVENEQRRNRRHRQAVLVAQLEELLPSSARRFASKNGAGLKRSMGTDGRTMHDILQDALRLVRDIRSLEAGSSPAPCVRRADDRQGVPIDQPRGQGLLRMFTVWLCRGVLVAASVAHRRHCILRGHV